MDPSSSSSSSMVSFPSSNKRQRDPNSYDEPRPKRPKNDVFLNYSVEDCGKSFVSHLKGALTRNGFNISDHTKLPTGQDVNSELLKAIDESHTYLVVFSANYALSTDSLDELALIMDRHNCLPKFNKKGKVFPVFFKIDPSDVKNQQGCFKDAFQAHNTKVDQERVHKWRQALKDVAHLAGQTLQYGEYIELFTRLTFGKDDPGDNKKFVEEVVCCAGGLPLVLEVWSHHFNCHKRKHWPSILETLKRIPHEDIQKKLQVSFDSLTKRAKNLFLDIACFFHGWENDFVVKVLQDEDSGFDIEIEIQNLVDKCLVKIDYGGRLSLHDVIREMGKEVVRQENEDEPGQRTRLMDPRDIIRVLTDCSGTDSIKSIIADDYMFERPIVKVEAFKKMSNLRFFRLADSRLQWSFSSSSKDDMSPTCFKHLKYLEWKGFPFKSINNIDMGNVVVINLRNSKLETLWEGVKSLKKLRILDVSHSKSLTKTGNFIGLEKLEELRLEGCENLKEIDSSIGCLEKLVLLDLFGCTRLKSFPSEKIGKLTSLVEFNLNDCPNILKISHEVGTLKSLKYLGLSQHGFPQLPDNLCQLHELRNLDLSRCANLKSIPNLPPNIKSVIADNCISLVNLPSNMSELQFLQNLELTGCANLKSISNLPPKIEYVIADNCISLVNLPSNMSELQLLQILCLDNCFKLEPEGFTKVTGLRNLRDLIMRNCNVSQVSCEIGNLESLEYLDLSENTFCSLPDSFSNLSQLVRLKINDCSELQLLPLLPSNLESIEACRCWSLDVMPYDPHEVGTLKSLEYLGLRQHGFPQLPDNLCQLHELSEIELSACTHLKSIPNLPPNIKSVKADDCISLVNLPSNMSELQSLQELDLNGCFKLEPDSFMKVTGLRNLYKLSMRNCDVWQVSSEIGNLESLEYLDLSENTFCSLPDSFSNLSQLVLLKINDCSELRLLPLLPSNLESIKACRCWSLDVMPYDPMQRAYVFHHKKLNQESFFNEQLVIRLSGEEVPDWCNYTSSGDVLSFVAPMHLDNKQICGVILCGVVTKLVGFYLKMLNKTKETDHLFKSVAYSEGSMLVMMYPLNDTTLVVEAGDTVEFQFDVEDLSLGLSWIYESDAVDSKLVIQPTFDVRSEVTATITSRLSPLSSSHFAGNLHVSGDLSTFPAASPGLHSFHVATAPRHRCHVSEVFLV